MTARPRPFVSGFCNPTLPRTGTYDPHTQCGSARCVCPCHTPEEPVRTSQNGTANEAPPNLILAFKSAPAATPEETEARMLQLAEDSGLPVGQFMQALAKALNDPVTEPLATTWPPDPTPERLAHAVRLVAESADVLNVEAMAIDQLDPEETIRLLAQLRDAVWLLNTIDATLVRHAYLTGEHGKRVVDGVGEVWVARGRSNERWDTQGAARAVVDARMAERGGELPDDPQEVVTWLLEAAGISYFRKTALRSLGVPVDAYYESLPGKLQVTLPSRT